MRRPTMTTTADCKAYRHPFGKQSCLSATLCRTVSAELQNLSPSRSETRYRFASPSHREPADQTAISARQHTIAMPILFRPDSGGVSAQRGCLFHISTEGLAARPGIPIDRPCCAVYALFYQPLPHRQTAVYEAAAACVM